MLPAARTLRLLSDAAKHRPCPQRRCQAPQLPASHPFEVIPHLALIVPRLPAIRDVDRRHSAKRRITTCSGPPSSPATCMGRTLPSSAMNGPGFKTAWAVSSPPCPRPRPAFSAALRIASLSSAVVLLGVPFLRPPVFFLLPSTLATFGSGGLSACLRLLDDGVPERVDRELLFGSPRRVVDDRVRQDDELVGPRVATGPSWGWRWITMATTSGSDWSGLAGLAHQMGLKRVTVRLHGLGISVLADLRG
jgi:hypothetical protein